MQNEKEFINELKLLLKKYNVYLVPSLNFPRRKNILTHIAIAIIKWSGGFLVTKIKQVV